MWDLCVHLFSLWWQERFTQDMQPHYIYSPREMTRWVRGICEALKPLETLSVEGLVRLWAHEALRLFQDRWGFWVFCDVTVMRTTVTYQTQKDRVWPHFQALRREFRIWHIAEYFWRTSRCLGTLSNTVFGVWYSFSIGTKAEEKTLKYGSQGPIHTTPEEFENTTYRLQ